ncbi:MAG: hypothetical protein JNL81_07670 [Hyphomonadaceae bacterium]|nr:hypothetical protein [Hyphomonadaceae bacterium]
MFRALIAMACLLACGAATAEPALGVATVEARLTADGLRADIQLSRPVTSFAFAEADVVREGDFTVLTAGLTLSGDTISAESPFRHFSVLVRPMEHERDAKYPAFFRVGAGGVLYAPALSADGDTWRTAMRLRPRPGEVVVPARGAREQGSVFIGPRHYVVTTPQARIIASPETPAPLRAAASAEMLRSIQFYTEQVGIPLPTRPVMVLAYGGDGSGYVGDVTPGPFVSLRLYGSTWSVLDENTRAGLSRFISHEAFHFWNGSLVTNRDSAPSWLHEGGAEYAALLSARNALGMSEAEVLSALGEALTRCQSGLRAAGDVGMNRLAFLSSSVRYPCGVVIQWAADLAIRKQSNGERNVFDAWAATTHAALAREDHDFVLTDFTRYDGVSRAARVITLLTETSGPERWESLAIALRDLGAGLEMRPSNETRRQALLFHILNQACSNQRYGFSLDQRGLTIEDVSTCGVLAGGPTVNTIENGDAISTSVDTYRRVQAACAAGRDVEFVVDGSRRINVPCRAPLPDAPNAYFVTAG